jgi:hypothetical protein
MRNSYLGLFFYEVGEADEPDAFGGGKVAKLRVAEDLKLLATRLAVIRPPPQDVVRVGRVAVDLVDALG